MYLVAPDLGSLQAAGNIAGLSARFPVAVSVNGRGCRVYGRRWSDGRPGPDEAADPRGD